MDVARVVRLINNADLLCTTDLAGVSRTGCRIGSALRDSAVLSNAGAVQGMDVRSQWRDAGVHGLVAVSLGPRLPGGPRFGGTM